MRLFNYLANQAWAIHKPALDQMLSIFYGWLDRKETGESFNKYAVEKMLGHPLDNSRTVTHRDGVATIPVSGPIFRYADFFTEISGGTTVQTLAQDFNAAMNDAKIHSIILYIDSPGGEVNGINEFSQMVHDARDKKHIVAYVAHLGASAAYWIASAADEIVADATSELGSIGVVAAVRDPQKENSRVIEFVSSQSPNKRPDPHTEAGKTELQNLVDTLADVFVETVAKNRNVSTENVLSEFGKGGLLIGQKAVDAGLADRLGSYEGLLAELSNGKRKKMRGGASASVEILPKTKGISKGEGKMSFMDKVKAKLQELGVLVAEAENNEGAAPSSATNTAMADAKTNTEVEKLRAENAAANKELETLKAAQQKTQHEGIKTEVESYVSQMLSGNKLFPAEKDDLVNALVQAVIDDVNSPLTTGSRVATIKAQIEKRKPHQLTKEMVASAATQILIGTADTKEKKVEFMKLTPLGQQTLKLVKSE